jgi:hypothetical protein
MGDEKNMKIWCALMIVAVITAVPACKITDDQTIEIHATPEQVYEYIETMPNKFPTFTLFGTKPLLFLRIAMVDGVRSGLKVIQDKTYRNDMMKKEAEPLLIKSRFGPFTFIEAKKPEKYYFSLNSFFFEGETGYKIFPGAKGTILHFDLHTDTTKVFQIVWIHAIMPVHVILARIVLRNIKEGVELKTKQ